MKALLLLGLLPLAAQAQLTFYAVNGGMQASVGATYQVGQVPLNTTASVQFRVYNVGSTPVSVNVTLSGTGFTFAAPVLPFVIPPNSPVTQTLNITVSFTPNSTAQYSANLQINSLSVILLGSGVTAPTLTSTNCTSVSAFNFGSVQTGNSSSCTFTLQNLNPQAVAVASMVVSGPGFSGPIGVTAPLMLFPNNSVSFSINFTPPDPIAYSGTLVISIPTSAQAPLTQSYALSGAGQSTPVPTSSVLPTPVLQFDSGTFASGQQRVLSMTIPGGSPIDATGYVNLAFTPSTSVVEDDSEIVFLAGSVRAVPFSVKAGATTVLLNGQNSAAFQTGTTEGTITFTVTTAVEMTGDPTTKITIGGASVLIDSATASKEVLGSLVVTITGADNTYSTSSMSFSILDTSGNPIGSTVTANFAAAFKSYYATVNAAGSAFIAQITFPVSGSAANIGTVTVTLTNAAGVANTGSLTFQ